MTEIFPSAESHLEKKLFEVKEGYESFVPEEFKSDPFSYFEKHGINIKPGESKYSEDEEIHAV